MNKKLLTAAIAAGLMVPGLAAADVKIYGVIQAETGNVDIDIQGGADTDDTVMGGGGNNGAIVGGGPNTLGFKGTEKLGNGLTAYFKMAWQFDTFNSLGSGGDFAPRERVVGLKGKGWHVHFGETSSLYKTASHKYDPFVATGLQMRGNGGVSNLHNGYAEDIMEVGFKSGNWSGGIQVTWEDASGDLGAAGLGGNNKVDAGSWNGRVMYKTKSWEASLSYMDVNIDRKLTTESCAIGSTTVTPVGSSSVSITTIDCSTLTTGSRDSDYDAWKIAGKWKGNGFTVAAQYESIDGDNTNVGDNGRPDAGSTASGQIIGLPGKVGGSKTRGGRAEDYDSLMIAVSYKMSGNTSIHGTYANTDWDEIGNVAGLDVDGTHWAIGVTHSLSKRTMVYGGYMDTSYDFGSGNPDIDVDAWGLGLRHKF